MSKDTVKRGLAMLEEMMKGPPGVTDRTLAKQQKIAKQAAKDTRMAYAMVEKREYCEKLLPDLDEEDADENTP